MLKQCADKLLLVMPDSSHEAEYCRVMDKWEAFNEKIQPPSIRRWSEKENFSYSKWLMDLGDDRTAATMLENNIPCTLYFLMNDADEILGGVGINHANTFRGHIHIGIVPWHRGKGYGTAMLSLALPKCREMGLDKVQMAPRKDNHGAIQVILRNGGILTEEFFDGGTACRRYEIDLQVD